MSGGSLTSRRTQSNSNGSNEGGATGNVSTLFAFCTVWVLNVKSVVWAGWY